MRMKFKCIHRCKARPRNLRPVAASGLSGLLPTALYDVTGIATTSASATIWDSSLDTGVTGEAGLDVSMTSSVMSSSSSSLSLATGLLTDKIYSGSTTVSSYIFSEQKVSISKQFIQQYSKRIKNKTTHPNVNHKCTVLQYKQLEHCAVIIFWINQSFNICLFPLKLNPPLTPNQSLLMDRNF